MKIGFFSDSYLPRADGIAFSIETFRRELEKLGHEVYIIAPAPGIRYKEASPNVIRFPAVKGLVFDDYLTSFFFPPQAIQKIKKLDLDIVHFHTPAQIGLLGAHFALRQKLPLISTYHADLYEYVTHYPQVLPGAIALSLLSPMIFKGSAQDLRFALSGIKPERNVDAWNRKIVVRGMTILHNYCDRVIAPSRKIEHQLKSWGTESPIRILPTGVDKITTTERAKAAFCLKNNIDSKDQVILFIGRLGTEKNIDLLLHSFAHIYSTHPRAKLVLIGRHEHMSRWEVMSAQLGIADRVVFTGYMDHDRLGAAYETARVFAFPSRTDTQGLVLHEAAAAGLPIVMIDKDITEIVHNGVNGYFARNSSRDFAKKITTILDKEDVRLAMGAASEKLAEKFSASHQTKQLARLYENVLAGHSQAKKLPSD
jgi:1,2-diacylglycerol 3-alpha-glucosyltransferase